MQAFRKSVAACLVSLTVLAGCSPPPPPAEGPLTGGQQEEKKSPLPVVASPYPGPYETVVVDGAEMKQGRFEPGKSGGNLVRSIVGAEPKVFNPWTASDTQSRDLGGMMFAAPVGLDPYTGDVIPDMAKELKTDKDGVTYTTVLRKGLKWSDGKPITSADVEFTWNTIIKGGYGNASLRDVTTIDGKSPTVTIVDELTNKYVTPVTFAPFARLIGIPIAPKHIIEPILKGRDGRKKFQELWSATSNLSQKDFVTSGPFVVSRYVPSQRVELVPTKNFYMVDKQKKRLPYLDKLVYQIVPDVNANLLKFRGKELDLTVVRARDTVDMLSHQDEENFKLYNLGQSIGTTFLMLNMNRRKDPKTGKPYVDPVKSEWFNDVNFRQAVNHILDRDNMVANYFKGIGFPLFTAEPPASPYFNANLKPFQPSLDESMRLLAQSGFTKKEDGMLYDKNGNRVEFDMITASGGTFYETIGNMIVNDLKKLGMKVNFQMIDFNILAGKVDQSLDWQACIMSLSPGDPLEPNDGANVYKTAGRMHLFDLRHPDAKGDVHVTDARPWENELDAIFNEGARTLDKEKRRALYNQYQQIVYDQSPFIFLCSAMVIVGVRNDIGNYQPTPLSQSVNGLHNLEEIYKK